VSIESTLKYIHSVSWRGSKLGLDRIRELMDLLGNPDRELKFVHVAGTNGKGSTCACIASVLTEAGYKTGLFTSPYIMKFNERMQIDGEYISDEDLEKYTDIIRPFADGMEDKPTEFELITAVAMEYFRSEGCDIVVLEVGLGGELDSTNVIDPPEAAVITSIGLDHTAQLGSTITDIAMAKAGIIKPGCDVVISGGDEEADAVFERVCAERGCRLHKVDRDKINVKSESLKGISFDYDSHKNITIPLVGTYQPVNASTAVTAIDVLREKGWNISEKDLKKGLKKVKWPGRFEVLSEDPRVILDGAHNPHGMTATVESLKTYFPDRKGVFVVGAMADKDVAAMAELLAPIAEKVITVVPDNPRAMKAPELAAVFAGFGVDAEPADSIDEGVKRAFELRKGGSYICALGSLYFSADVRRAVKEAVTENNA
jgi:dihydrofolate synthase/folylpolyglutamate synthase